jgi:hypothetical protein
MNEIYMFVRDKQHNLCGVVMARSVKGVPDLGWSAYNRKGETEPFKKTIALDFARVRANSGMCRVDESFSVESLHHLEVPYSVRRALLKINERALYFFRLRKDIIRKDIIKKLYKDKKIKKENK